MTEKETHYQPSAVFKFKIKIKFEATPRSKRRREEMIGEELQSKVER